MPVRLVFRCQFCEADPDSRAEQSLTAQLQDLRFGQYADTGEGQWLVWHGRGPYGPTRYACAEHRVALREFVRKHYGTIGWHPHARVLGDVDPEVRRELAGPPPATRRATARQRRLSRGHGGFPGLV